MNATEKWVREEAIEQAKFLRRLVPKGEAQPGWDTVPGQPVLFNEVLAPLP
jgi:hypothetical protein